MILGTFDKYVPFNFRSIRFRSICCTKSCHFDKCVHEYTHSSTGSTNTQRQCFLFEKTFPEPIREIIFSRNKCPTIGLLHQRMAEYTVYAQRKKSFRLTNGGFLTKFRGGPILSILPLLLTISRISARWHYQSRIKI